MCEETNEVVEDLLLAETLLERALKANPARPVTAADAIDAEDLPPRIPDPPIDTILEKVAARLATGDQSPSPINSKRAREAERSGAAFDGQSTETAGLAAHDSCSTVVCASATSGHSTSRTREALEDFIGVLRTTRWAGHSRRAKRSRSTELIPSFVRGSSIPDLLILPGMALAGDRLRQSADLTFSEHAAILQGIAFYDAAFEGAVFSRALLRAVAFPHAQLARAVFDMSRFVGVTFQHSDLADASFYGVLARASQSEKAAGHNHGDAWVDFACADLTRANFATASLVGRFVKARVTAARFSDANLSLSSFAHASCVGATFADANLDGVDFTEADLRGVNFQRASLRRSNMSGANLAASDLRGCDLSEVRWGRPTYSAGGATHLLDQLSGALWNDMTKWPESEGWDFPHLHSKEVTPGVYQVETAV